MKEYLLKYPDEEQNVGALIFAFGYEETVNILTEAFRLNKKVELIETPDKIDYLEYKFI